MFMSADAQLDIDRNHMVGFVKSQQFWQKADRIVNAIPLLYKVLRAMDSEGYPQISFLYHMMMIVKTHIRQADLMHAKEYIDIIEKR